MMWNGNAVTGKKGDLKFLEDIPECNDVVVHEFNAYYVL